MYWYVAMQLPVCAYMTRCGESVELDVRGSAGGGQEVQELTPLFPSIQFTRHVLTPLQVRELDLASLASVRRFAAGWEAEGRPLHLLVNNAGVFTIGGGVGNCGAAK